MPQLYLVASLCISIFRHSTFQLFWVSYNFLYALCSFISLCKKKKKSILLYFLEVLSLLSAFKNMLTYFSRSRINETPFYEVFHVLYSLFIAPLCSFPLCKSFCYNDFYIIMCWFVWASVIFARTLVIQGQRYHISF